MAVAVKLVTSIALARPALFVLLLILPVPTTPRLAKKEPPPRTLFVPLALFAKTERTTKPKIVKLLAVLLSSLPKIVPAQLVTFAHQPNTKTHLALLPLVTPSVLPVILFLASRVSSKKFLVALR